MKTTKSLNITILALLGIGLGQVTGHSQTYFYSGPVSGWTELDLTPGSGYEGGGVTYFGTLTETLYYDPVAQTLQEVGSVTVNPSSVSFNISNLFPPEEGGGLVGSATLTVGNNVSFSFDDTAYYDDYFFSELLVPVSGSGIYDGQAFAGSWNINIRLREQIIAASPTSLTLSEFGVSQAGGFYDDGEPGFGIGDANQGVDGLTDGREDNTYYYYWPLGTVVATAVPEPNSLAILGLASFGITLLRRRQR